MTETEFLIKKIRITAEAERLGLEFDPKNPKLAKCKNCIAPEGFTLKFNKTLAVCPKCGWGGDVVRLNKDFGHGITTEGAIEQLKDVYGLEIPRKEIKSEPRQLLRSKAPLEIDSETETDPLFSEIYQSFMDICRKSVSTSAWQYLTGNKRGLTEEIIQSCQLFSVHDYTLASNALKRKYDVEVLKSSGLFNAEGNLVFYKHTIIIPVFDFAGNLSYLRGRYFYEGSPDSLDGAKMIGLNGISAKRLWIGPLALRYFQEGADGDIHIAEGEFDGMALEQHDYPAVALLGNQNWHDGFAQKLKSFKPVIYIDNPKPGCDGEKLKSETDIREKAISKIGDSFLKAGNENIQIANLPLDVKDVTDYYLSNPTVEIFKSPYEPSDDSETLEHIRIDVLRNEINIPQIARYLLLKYKIIYHKKLLWIYRHEMGAFYELDEALLDSYISDFLEAIDPTQSTDQNITSIKKRMIIFVQAKKEYRPEVQAKLAQEFLCLENGMLHIASRRLFAHNKFFFSFYRFPFRYDPKAYSPNWESFIEFACASKHEEGFMPEPAVMLLIRNYMAYVLSESISHQFYMHIIGNSGTGKTTLGNVLLKMIGPDKSMMMKINNDKDPFLLQNIRGKKFIFVNEMDSSYMESSVEEMLKSLTSFDPIAIRQMYKGFKDARNEAKTLVCSNNFPHTTDSSGALMRRLLLVKFDRVIPKDQASRWIGETNNFESELSGIFNWLLEGFKAIEEKGHQAFDLPPVCKEWKKEIVTYSNHIINWARENTKINGYNGEENKPYPDKFRSRTSELYTDYDNWCMVNGVGKFKQNRVHFSRKLLQAFHEFITRDRMFEGRVMIGIRLKTMEERETEERELTTRVRGF